MNEIRPFTNHGGFHLVEGEPFVDICVAGDGAEVGHDVDVELALAAKERPAQANVLLKQREC